MTTYENFDPIKAKRYLEFQAIVNDAIRGPNSRREFFQSLGVQLLDENDQRRPVMDIMAETEMAFTAAKRRHRTNPETKES